MTREELKDTVEIQCKYLWNGGLNVDAAISTIMAAIGKAESREIPPPPLKWDTDSQYGDEYTSVVAYVFGLKFAAWNTGGGYTSRVEKRGHWDDGYGIRRHESLKEAREALLAYWKEIWGKEMCP